MARRLLIRQLQKWCGLTAQARPKSIGTTTSSYRMRLICRRTWISTGLLMTPVPPSTASATGHLSICAKSAPGQAHSGSPAAAEAELVGVAAELAEAEAEPAEAEAELAGVAAELVEAARSKTPIRPTPRLMR